MTAQGIAEVMGGQKALKIQIGSDSDLAKLTRKGLPVEVLPALAGELDMSRDEIARVVGISSRTLSRRLSSRGRMSLAESDRTVRVARLLAFAKEVFGDMDRASEWLQMKNVVLGERPFDMLDTDFGIRSVETVLGRIAWGIYS